MGPKLIGRLLVSIVVIGGSVALTLTPAQASSAEIVLSPSAAPPGSVISVDGSGFGADEAVDIYFDTTEVGLAATDDTGAFSKSITIPSDATRETHWISAVGRQSGLAQEPFLVSSDWRQFRRSAAQDGWNPYEMTLSPSTVSQLQLTWSYFAGSSRDGYGVSGLSTVAGLLYAGAPSLGAAGQSYALALNAATGALEYRVAYNDRGRGPQSSSPSVIDGKIYIDDVYSSAFALAASDGATVWSKSFYDRQNEAHGDELVKTGVVYITGERRSVALCARRADTGRRLWCAHDAGTLMPSPAVEEGLVFAGASHSLCAFRATDGGRAWCYRTDNYVVFPPSFANGVVYDANEGDTLFALDARTGAVRWNHVFRKPISSSTAVANGVVYIRSANSIHALSASTGAILWSSPGGNGEYNDSFPAAANGVVYMGFFDGKVSAFDAADGSLLWSFTTDAPVQWGPIVANGYVYAASKSGEIYAFSLPGGTRSAKRPNPHSLHQTLSATG
jgi:outer membrane protein assembly factor BamB